jgi:hypothetical protein
LLSQLNSGGTTDYAFVPFADERVFYFPHQLGEGEEREDERTSSIQSSFFEADEAPRGLKA